MSETGEQNECEKCAAWRVLADVGVCLLLRL